MGMAVMKKNQQIGKIRRRWSKARCSFSPLSILSRPDGNPLSILKVAQSTLINSDQDAFLRLYRHRARLRTNAALSIITRDSHLDNWPVVIVVVPSAPCVSARRICGAITRTHAGKWLRQIAGQWNHLAAQKISPGRRKKRVSTASV